MKNKSILMCYRGSDKSSIISSATKNYLEKQKVKLNMEYINIDKRNLSKFVNSLLDREIPLDIIYVYDDEEMLLDLLSNTTVEVRLYNMDLARKGKYLTQKGCYNGIAEDLMNEYKYSLGSYEFWVVKNKEPKKIKVSKYDYDNCSFKQRFHKTKYDCYEKILNEYNKHIQRKESEIALYENMINTAKSDIKNSKKKVKSLEKLLDNYDDSINTEEAEIITDLNKFRY